MCRSCIRLCQADCNIASRFKACAGEGSRGYASMPSADGISTTAETSRAVNVVPARTLYMYSAASSRPSSMPASFSAPCRSRCLQRSSNKQDAIAITATHGHVKTQCAGAAAAEAQYELLCVRNPATANTGSTHHACTLDCLWCNIPHLLDRSTYSWPPSTLYLSTYVQC